MCNRITLPLCTVMKFMVLHGLNNLKGLPSEYIRVCLENGRVAKQKKGTMLKSRFGLSK